MQKFQLEILFQIIGIGSASGLCYKDHSVFVISDNGGYLYEYCTLDQSLDKIQIIESDTLENIPKKQKPDFEALAFHDHTFYAFGSGSTQNRNKMVAVDTQSKEISTTDLTALYASMQSFAGIKPEDFNIEGAACDGETWYFLQRGNGPKGRNVLFTVKGKNLEYDFSIVYNEFKLPKINGIRASFTDATLVGAKLYFLATAEDTQSTYHDGEIKGSLLGMINLAKMKIAFTKKITNNKKFEGIALYNESSESISFLLCEDNDSNVLDTAVFKLVLHK